LPTAYAPCTKGMPNPPAAAADFSKLRRVSIIVVIAFLPLVAPSPRCRLIRHFTELSSWAYDWPGGPVWQGF
jgi:hypothetical protein